MLKISSFIGCFLIVFTALGQVTFVVNKVAEGQDEKQSIYISGDFEGWTGGQEKFKLIEKESYYFVTLSNDNGAINYKFTQGSWDSVETNLDGSSIENRTYSLNKKNDTVKVTIQNWATKTIKVSTATSNVSVMSSTFNIPQLNQDRRVWVYLPPGYENSTESYPVLYMHDGQNLFDDSTSFSGEWNVDETLNKLFIEEGLKLIVVGVDNGGDNRLNEYTPWNNLTYGGGHGEAYVDFLVKTLKPHIDTNYRTKKNKEHTAIIGSSLGGLISHYAALKHPDVYGKVGVFSPSFWFSDQSYEFAKQRSRLNSAKMYFLAGDNESPSMVPNMEKMLDEMVASGFEAKNIQKKIVVGGQHNEKLWSENFEETILWLFPEAKKERRFKSLKQTYFATEIEVSDGVYHLMFYSEKIVEVAFVPNGEKLVPLSHAVIKRPENMEFSISMHGDVIFNGTEFVKSIEEDKSKAIIKTEGIQIEVQKEPFKISYSYKGKPIISEGKGYHKTEYGEALQFSLTEQEVLYGGGARALGMNRRGNRLQLYNKAHYGYETKSELMNYTLPIVISSNQYMIHFDNAPVGYLDLDSKGDNTLTYETISGRKTYQVIVGDSWYDLIDNYTYLTGKQPMPPRWALGNFSSRFGYHSQQEAEATINKFIKEEIPVDAIILDLYWFGKEIKGTMGNLEVFRDSFPDFEGMVSRFKSKGVKTITITEPFVLSTSKRWEEAVSADVLAKDSLGNPYKYDFYFGNTGLIDIYKPKAEQWFWNIYKDLIHKGVAGVWGDLGEPEVHPKDLIHESGTADEVHNIYGHDWARLVHDGYKRDFPNTRPFILMRAGYSGSQRYGLIPWSGDVNRTWGGLQSQPEIALQMGMQGLGYMHSDLGGFAGANLDDELYARWLQYGVFQPIFRPHAQEEVPSEPVFRSDKTKALAKQAIELRYRFLPYNYNLTYENNQEGKPLMRPLFFEETDNRQLFNYSKTYLWGHEILVSPVLEAGKKEQDIYFPKNNVWFDFYTDEAIVGGQTKTIILNESSIPTYIRAGAFIPLAKPMQNTELYDANNLELHFYNHSSIVMSKGKMYNDNGEMVGAEGKENYEKLFFQSELKRNYLELNFEAQTGINYQSKLKQISLIIHNIKDGPKRIKVDGKLVNGNWDSGNNRLTIPVIWYPSKGIDIKIKLKK